MSSDLEMLKKGASAGRNEGYLKELLGSYKVEASEGKFSKREYPEGNPWPMNGEKVIKKATDHMTNAHTERKAGEGTPVRERTEKNS